MADQPTPQTAAAPQTEDEAPGQTLRQRRRKWLTLLAAVVVAIALIFTL